MDVFAVVESRLGLLCLPVHGRTAAAAAVAAGGSNRRGGDNHTAVLLALLTTHHSNGRDSLLPAAGAMTVATSWSLEKFLREESR